MEEQTTQVTKEPKPRAKKEPSEPAKLIPLPDVEPDWSTEQDVRGTRLPANVMLSNAAGSVMLGDNYDNGMSISGIVVRLTLVPQSQTIRVKVRTSSGTYRYSMIFSSGMQVEIGEPTESDKRRMRVL